MQFSLFNNYLPFFDLYFDMVRNNRDIEALKKLGARIKEVRELKGISQEDLALKIGTTQKQIWRMEQGLVDITYSRLKAIALIFEVEISELSRPEEDTEGQTGTPS